MLKRVNFVRVALTATLVLSPAAAFVGCAGSDAASPDSTIAQEGASEEAQAGDTTAVTFKLDGDVPQNTEIYLLAQRISGDEPIAIGHTVTPSDLAARSVTFELPSKETYIIDVTSALDADGTIYVASTPNGLIETNMRAQDAYIQLERHAFEDATQDEYYHLYYILQALLSATEGDVDMNNVVATRTLALDFAQQKPETTANVVADEATDEAADEEYVDDSGEAVVDEYVEETIEENSEEAPVESAE